MRVLVWGTGSIGARHLGVLAQLRGVEPVALPVRPARRASLRRQGFEVVRSLADAGPIGAAVIATSTARHPLDLASCLEQGIENVLVEKPLGPEARTLRHVKVGPGRSVFTGFCLRFDSGLTRFRQLLPRIGRPYHVDAEARSYLPSWRPGRDYRTLYAADRHQGGVLRDLLHEVDYCLWLYGRPRAIRAWLGRSGSLAIRSEDQAALTWRVDGGPTVNIGLDYLARRPVRRMTAYGDRGTLTWDALERTITLSAGPTDTRRYRPGGRREDMYRRQMETFLGAARGRGTGPLATYEEGLLALTVADAARTSSRTQRNEPVTA